MKPSLDRIDFRPEQCLSRSDLLQASARTADLLALHAARTHGVWGVATGWPCTLNAAGTVVVAGPGVALDACGHQLINSADRVLPLPAVPNDGRAYVVDLIARFVPTAGIDRGCHPGRLPVERAELRWEIAGPTAGDATSRTSYSPRVNLGSDVPIARLTTATAATAAVISTASRPMAHAITRPKIATGHIPQSMRSVDGTYADWSMTVSTAAAGFEAPSSPVYLVSLDAHPLGETASLRVDSRLGPSGVPPDLLTRLGWRGPFVSIEYKDHGSFTLRVFTAATNNRWASLTRAQLNPVAVSWAGIDTRDPGPFYGQFWFFSNVFSAVIG